MSAVAMAGAAEQTETETHPIVDASRVRELLSYDVNTGEFRWAKGVRSHPLGKLAGGAHNAGYRTIRVDGVAFLSHRLAWLYVHGRWPSEQIDHINGDRADNRLSNLRECTNAQNCQNIRAHRDSTSKHVGVSAVKGRPGKAWQAQICVNGRQRNLGRFATEESALVARLAAKQKIHTFNPKQGGF